MPATPLHTLVVYGASERADTALRKLAKDAVRRGGRVTVLSLAIQEPRSRCCDTRAVLWNQVRCDLARTDLARASRAAGAPGTVECALLLFSGRRPADAVMREALARGADEIVLADGRAGGLGALQRRRLRRLGPVPVSEAA